MMFVASCGCGGIGRRAGFRSQFSQGSGGSSPLIRTTLLLSILHPSTRSSHLTRSRWNGRTGYLYCGPSGSGHFVKMIHNGIEYGLMQSYAEGFDILRNANSKELASLFTRFRSRQDHTYAEKVLSAMRNKFGGHVERPAGG
jgi:6-phosphogluconate dehydrogenase (decarboxylating)